MTKYLNNLKNRHPMWYTGTALKIASLFVLIPAFLFLIGSGGWGFLMFASPIGLVPLAAFATFFIGLYLTSNRRYSLEQQSFSNFAEQPSNITVIHSSGSGIITPENSKLKKSKIGYAAVALSALLILGVGLYFFVMLGVAGKTGSEFVALYLFMTLVPAVEVIALINTVLLLIYITRNKPRGKKLILSITALCLSIPLILYGAYNFYQTFVVLPSQMSQRNEQSLQLIQDRQNQFAADNAKPEITKDEAIQLLKTCQLKGFYYTNQTNKEDGGWGELSSTGVVLTKVDGKPYRISIADRLVTELVPIARESQKTCGGPQFWHDGYYEHYKDGRWYFGDKIVNNTKTGDSKEKALQLMHECKVDYFTGVTGEADAVKDSNTQSWLKQAEESSSGIAILENSPKTYVFASRAMTEELENTARQYRQSCYNKKKLYIAIDDWIETEYPVGTWTRVRQ